MDGILSIVRVVECYGVSTCISPVIYQSHIQVKYSCHPQVPKFDFSIFKMRSLKYTSKLKTLSLDADLKAW